MLRRIDIILDAILRPLGRHLSFLFIDITIIIIVIIMFFQFLYLSQDKLSI